MHARDVQNKYTYYYYYNTIHRSITIISMTTKSVLKPKYLKLENIHKINATAMFSKLFHLFFDKIHIYCTQRTLPFQNIRPFRINIIIANRNECKRKKGEQKRLDSMDITKLPESQKWKLKTERKTFSIMHFFWL